MTDQPFLAGEPGTNLRTVHVSLPTATTEGLQGIAELIISLTIADDGALLVYLDTPGWEPGPSTLRVNVNDGPVFGYPELAESSGDPTTGGS